MKPTDKEVQRLTEEIFDGDHCYYLQSKGCYYTSFFWERIMTGVHAISDPDLNVFTELVRQDARKFLDLKSQGLLEEVEED